MSETKQRFPYLKQVAIGAVSGLALLAVIVAGFGLSGGSTAPTASSTQAGPSAAPSATPSASASSLRTCSVAEQASDPLLGSLQAVVMNPATDEILFDRGATTPAATASALKVLTAAAALTTLGPNYRVDTRVYSDPANPGVIYLVGGGDPTLSRTAPGTQSVYKDAPKLSTLASTVNSRLAGTAIKQIVVDASLFPGSTWEPSWERSEQTQGYMSEVSALQVDGDRDNPNQETSKRSTMPAKRAGAWFKKALGAIASTAAVVEGKTPTTATEIAKVQSAPISNWITHMLQVSDNTQAEALARLVSLDQGYDGSFTSVDAAIKKALSVTGVDSTGLVLKDGSGLSAQNAVPPIYFAKLFKVIMTGAHDFTWIMQGLPVAGESGSLADRFKGDFVDANGKIAAKTGWIKHGYTLAGIITAKDGTKLTFAIYALGNVSDSAKKAIDALATGFYRCGNQLSNQ
ncbi:MAG: D-alanyl-D-alanine carboxypeptidase/D-alanyl-D-alanine-endopeptidase [Actinomycetales bacterium]|nr:D-alanyl-D-alanine carboxypeptidase/D-alanyl-D-alanine-endopeptidase [Actinomycetales bacterium]